MRNSEGGFGSDFGSDFGSNGGNDGESNGESDSKIQLSDRQKLILSAIVTDGSETAAHLARVT